MAFSLTTSRTFGIELETVSNHDFPFNSAARAVCKALGVSTSLIYRESHLSARCIPMQDGSGRVWKVESDASLSHGGAEIVSPPLHLSELPLLQKVARTLSDAGCTTDSSCGAHVHIDAADLDAADLRRLVNTFFSKQTLLLGSNGTQENRYNGGYCDKLSKEFVDAINKAKPTTLPALARYWYGRRSYSSGTWQPCDADTARYSAGEHYNSSRYHTLNLHPVFDPNRHSTVEFRLFDGTLDPDQIEANVLLAASMVEMAHASKSASAKVAPSQNENPKYTFRCFLLRLGFIGDEFKTARTVLLNRLQGDTAWLRGKDAYPAYHAQVAARRAS